MRDKWHQQSRITTVPFLHSFLLTKGDLILNKKCFLYHKVTIYMSKKYLQIQKNRRFVSHNKSVQSPGFHYSSVNRSYQFILQSDNQLIFLPQLLQQDLLSVEILNTKKSTY